MEAAEADTFVSDFDDLDDAALTDDLDELFEPADNEIRLLFLYWPLPTFECDPLLISSKSSLSFVLP